MENPSRIEANGQTAILYLGDCLDILDTLEENSIDAIITDPPYELGFMGKKWDNTGIAFRIEVWKKCLRVLKPGGHLIAFGAPRNFHRLTVAIEDAGFECRDLLLFLFGCLDEQTQVCTAEGVKPYHKCKVGELVLCYNVNTYAYSYEPILDIYEYDYANTAYRITGDFGEQVVTAEHRCIIESGGAEVFCRAYACEHEIHIPALEDLRALHEALSSIHARAGDAESVLPASLLKNDSTQPEDWQDNTAGEEKSSADPLLCLPEAIHPVLVPYEGEEKSILQHPVQRGDSRGGMEAARPHGQELLDPAEQRRPSQTNDGRDQSSVARGPDLQESQGQIQQSVNQVRALPDSPLSDGAQGWLRDAAPLDGSARVGSRTSTDGMRASYQSRCDRQSPGEFDALREQYGAQEIRAWPGHKSHLATITPFFYEGRVWCIRVATGAFVAERNGAVFPTGNSGFPKSHNVSKAIDKLLGAEREVLGINPNRRPSGNKENNLYKLGTVGKADVFETKAGSPQGALWEGWGSALKPAFEPILLAAKPVVKKQSGAKFKTQADQMGNGGFNDPLRTQYIEKPPESEEAIKWAGWGSALKPAFEPIILARKPLEKSIAANTLKWGTGGVNVDACRINTVEDLGRFQPTRREDGVTPLSSIPLGPNNMYGKPIADQGRWPANVMFDREAARMLDEQSGTATKLRPGFDPIILARKPIEGTLAKNVMAYGTGALHIEACRIDYDLNNPADVHAVEQFERQNKSGVSQFNMEGNAIKREVSLTAPSGRWPSNVLLDKDAAQLIDKQSGTSGSKAAPSFIDRKRTGFMHGTDGVTKNSQTANAPDNYGDAGGASRYFFIADSRDDATNFTPDFDPIILARKPIDKSIAHNVLTWGVGALNIGACRIGDEVRTYDLTMKPSNFQTTGGGLNATYDTATVAGRWPSNVILDESVGGILSEQSRFFYSAKAQSEDRNAGLDMFEAKQKHTRGCHKSSIIESPPDVKVKNTHPTVKACSLMRYLVKLVTPKGGRVLDPFMGSGSTGKACLLEQCDFVGIEKEEEYFEISKARIKFLDPFKE